MDNDNDKKKRHKWNKKTTKEDFEATCLVCGLKKEVLGKHFGTLYFYDDFGYRYDRTPPCFFAIGEKFAEKRLRNNK